MFVATFCLSEDVSWSGDEEDPYFPPTLMTELPGAL